MTKRPRSIFFQLCVFHVADAFERLFFRIWARYKYEDNNISLQTRSDLDFSLSKVLHG